MTHTIVFIKDRTVKTISAAKQVSSAWTWADLSIAAMEELLAAVTGDATATPPVAGQEADAGAAEQVMLAARGTYDTALDQLHRWTVQGVGMAKARCRNDAAKSAQLANLSASESGREGILKEALAWESAWTNVDAAWVPLPGLTLAAFAALRKHANEDLKTAYADARATSRKASAKLGEMAADLNDVSQAWYASATRVFPEGTPEGDMIRGTIPTTYTPPPPPPAPAPPAP
jgi:hypothetical protein